MWCLEGGAGRGKKAGTTRLCRQPPVVSEHFLLPHERTCLRSGRMGPAAAQAVTKEDEAARCFATWVQAQSCASAWVVRLRSVPSAFLSEDSRRPPFLPQIPGGPAVWQQRETSSGRHLSLQPTFQKDQLHCLQYSEK